MESLPLEKVYRFIEPGPVMMMGTQDGNRANLMTMSVSIMLQEQNPPIVGCGLGPWDYSYETLLKTGECVLAIPTVELLVPTVQIGNCSGREVDKFSKFGLTPLPAERVSVPLVAECPVNLECQLADSSLIEKYNLFAVKVVKAWVDPTHKERRFFHHNGDGTFTLDGERVDLKDEMVKWPEYIV